MTNKIIIALLLTIFQSLVFGQIKLSGVIIDKATRQTVEYANIGLPEKGIGTICNSLGKFDLIVPNNLLVISHIGYESSTLKITGLSSSPTELIIELKPSSIILQEITIMASQQVNLGYKPNGDKVNGFFKAAGLGLEGGTIIQNSGQVLLTRFNLNILEIPFDSLKFRLNIYSIKKGKPSKKVNIKDIIFTISKANKGFYSLPLVNENIQVTGNFICTIELIELFGQSVENAEFLFSAISNKDGCTYKRRISFGRWVIIKDYSLCFWLEGKK